MTNPPPDPDVLELLGLGGLYNGERYTVRAGASVTVGSSSLATCPVTRCRNYTRLTDSALRAELVAGLASEHIRFLHVGDGRLFIENLAGRLIEAGGLTVTERVEVDLRAGPVVVSFGLGERLVAGMGGDRAAPQSLCSPEYQPAGPDPIDPLSATLTPHGEPLRPEDLDPPLKLIPGPPAEEAGEAEEAGLSAAPEAPKLPAAAPESPPPAKASAATPKRRRSPTGSRAAMFFSILLHLVVILGLFSYIASGLVPPPGSMVTEVSVVTPTTIATAVPPQQPTQDSVPSEAPVAETDLPSVIDDEIPAEISEGSGLDDTLDQGLPGAPGGGLGGAIGLGPGGRLGGGLPGGGSGRTRPVTPKAGVQGPLRLALDWLSRHQEEDGSWGGLSAMKGCADCLGNGKREYRIALTGLATLAFAGAGNTHRKGEFKETVRASTKFLLDRCDRNGSFHGEMVHASDRPMYGQAIAVLALSEVYRQSRSPFLKKALTRAVRFIERAQTPYAGWRYQADGSTSDTSVTGWQVLALYAAERVGIAVNPATRSGARAWLAAMTENQTYRVGYNRRGRGSLAMTATGLTMNILLGRPPTDPAIRGGLRILAAHRPAWPPRGSPRKPGGGPDLYYWYFGTLATAKKRNSDWAPWRKALRVALLSNQDSRGEAKGSWPPVGQWEGIGGRVMATALGALCLELAEGLKTAFR